MLRFHMKAEAIPRILITQTYYSILTFNGVNRPRKIEKHHETSPKSKFRREMQNEGSLITAN